MQKTALLTAALAALICSSPQTEAPEKGNIDVAITKLDSYIGEAMQKTGVPGLAVAVVYHDRVAFLKGYGWRKLGEAAEVDPDTVFEIASLSKPITSTPL